MCSESGVHRGSLKLSANKQKQNQNEHVQFLTACKEYLTSWKYSIIFDPECWKCQNTLKNYVFNPACWKQLNQHVVMGITYTARWNPKHVERKNWYKQHVQFLTACNKYLACWKYSIIFDPACWKCQNTLKKYVFNPACWKQLKQHVVMGITYTARWKRHSIEHVQDCSMLKQHHMQAKQQVQMCLLRADMSV